MIQFHVVGSPRTKKNSNRLVNGKRSILPSRAWSYWCEYAVFIIPGKGGFRLQPPAWDHTVPCSINAQFYLDADNHADAVNLYQGLGDLLQARLCFPDDNILRDWDGSRVHVDRQNPRVEVTLKPAV